MKAKNVEVQVAKKVIGDPAPPIPESSGCADYVHDRETVSMPLHCLGQEGACWQATGEKWGRWKDLTKTRISR